MPTGVRDLLLLLAGAVGSRAVVGSAVVPVAPGDEVTLNRPADGYRGIWYANQPSGDEYVYKYSGGLGTYCAKHSPHAVYSAEVERTYFCYGGAPAEDSRHLLHMVSCFDHRTRTLPRPTILLDKQTGDAHDNPVISLDGAGHVWVFSTSHGRARPSYVHRSVRPHDVTEFRQVPATYLGDEGTARPLDNFSYLQVWRTGGRFLAFFTRYADPAPRTSMFMTSADGVAWSRWQRLAAIEEGHYQISGVTEGRAACAFNFHPRGKGLNWRTNLYYLETRDGGESWCAADGTRVEVPVTTRESAALVHDFQSAGRNVYLKDLDFDGEGRPWILFLTSAGYQAGPDSGPRAWTLARWDGELWRQSPVTTSDSNYDMGSLDLDGDVWRLFAPTLPGPQAFNPGGEMAMWRSDDRGGSWRLERRLTEGSAYNHTYARRPVNAHADLVSLWADGHGRQPSESRLYFADRAGNVYRLPWQMDGDTATPEVVARAGAR